MEAVAPLAEVFARLDNAATVPAGHSLRTRLIIALVRRRYPHLTERQTEAIGVMIRQLASSALWYRLTREHGLTTEEAAAVAEWTMRLQVEALERGDHPLSGTGHDG
jgi:hypothetical protein